MTASASFPVSGDMGRQCLPRQLSALPTGPALAGPAFSPEHQRTAYFASLKRWLVYASKDDQRFLFVAAARDEAHALKIGRQQGLSLSRTAYAVLERPCLLKRDVHGG